MARTVQLACARCGNSQMYIVNSESTDDAVSEFVRASGGETTDDASALAAIRQRRLETLPTSLPVGGIITPV